MIRMAIALFLQAILQVILGFSVGMILGMGFAIIFIALSRVIHKMNDKK